MLDAHSEVVRELQARIRRMQRNKLDTRALPTNPALADLVPGGALAAGSAYSVADSTTLALSLLQGPSAAGAWCAVVGVPDLGVEAAAGLGIDLERLVLVPHPGEQWLSVVSALVDVVSIMLVRPPVRDGRVRITDGSASKLASRLRQREAVLVSLGDWPGAPPVSPSRAAAGRGSERGSATSPDARSPSARRPPPGRVAPSHAGSGCPGPIRRSRRSRLATRSGCCRASG